MTNPQLQQELKEKVKEGVKSSDLKKLKKSKSDTDLNKIPPPPPLPSDLTDQLTQKDQQNEVLAKQIKELQSQLTAKTQELDQSLFARQQSLKQFGQIHSKLQAVKKELGENVDYASTELISQDDQISKLKGERIDFKFKIQQLEKDLSLAQRLAEMRKNPLPNYEKDLAPDFWPYLIWPLTLILIYWMLKSKHG